MILLVTSIWKSNRMVVLASTLATLCILLALPTLASGESVISITNPKEGSTIGYRSFSFDLESTVSDAKIVDFYCSIDGQVFEACGFGSLPSCFAVGPGQKKCQMKMGRIPLPQGIHTLRAFASECDSPCDPSTDGVDGPVITRTFFVDAIPPTVSLLSGPTIGSPLTRGLATFVFDASDATSVTCVIEHLAVSADPLIVVAPCQSPLVVNPVSNGRYRLTIGADDPYGNQSGPVEFDFRVDRFKPKKCTKPKSRKRSARAKYKRCVKANAKAKARWKKRNGI